MNQIPLPSESVHFDLNAPGSAVIEFFDERHLASLTIVDHDGAPHVTPVGVTYEPERRLARVITWAGSVKAKKLAAQPGLAVAICQVDGGRWLTIYGTATVTADRRAVAEGVDRYSKRYRRPKDRDDRVVIEIAVEQMIGRVPPHND